MSRRRCSKCIFRGVCDEHGICEDFSPTDDDLDEYHIGKSIRARGEDFLADWNEYMMGWDDGDRFEQ